MAAVLICVLLLSSVTTSTSQDQGKLPSTLDQNDSHKASSLKPLNVLLLAPPAWGHVNSILAVGEELVARGHTVTLCLGIVEDYRQKFEDKIASHGINFCHFSSDFILKMTPARNDPVFQHMIKAGTSLANYSAEMMQHISQSYSKASFDLVAGTEFTISALTCLSFLWNVPIVTVGTTASYFVHLQPQWAWPSVFVSSSDDLSFSQRAVNVIERLVFPAVFSKVFISPYKRSLRGFCPSVSQNEMGFGAGVMFPYIVPTVMGFDYPRTKFPLVEYVGPLLSRSPQALSAELADWLSSKPDRSVVYISMGSVWEVDKASAAAMLHGVMKTNNSLLWALRKPNQWVLGGLEVDSSRVLISEWTPQLSVLSSSAIHSAILHGGFNGLNEALSKGVPVIGFPLMIEQASNVGRLYYNQLGLQLDASTISSAIVTEAILEIDAGNYRQNSMKLQKLFKFAGGVRRAAELIEHYEEVGYDHLIPAYVKYDWTSVQYYNLDVYVVLVGVASMALGCLVALTRCQIRCALKRCKPKVKTD